MELILGEEKSVLLTEHTCTAETPLVITFFMLGDRAKGFIPSKQMFDEFRKQLAEVMDPGHKDPRILITHNFVSVMQVTIPQGAVAVGSSSKDDISLMLKLWNLESSPKSSWLKKLAFWRKSDE